MRILSTILFTFCFTNIFSQRIQYSRENLPIYDANAIRLVANVGGYHHVLYFGRKEKPTVYIFDEKLQLQQKKEINILLKENSDIRILPFRDFYFFYSHASGSNKHELLKIDRDGNATILSKLFQALVDSVLKKSAASLQLINQHDRLYVFAQKYYDGLRQIGATVCKLNYDLQVEEVHRLFYPFSSLC